MSEDVSLVVEAAKIVASDQFKSRSEWEYAVARTAARLRYLLAEHSVPMRVLRSAVLYVRILEVKLEDSSQRYLVTFQGAHESSDANAKSKTTKTIYSDRVDGKNGEVVHEMWKLAKGHIVRLYEYMEPTNDENHPPVRVAPLVEILN